MATIQILTLNVKARKSEQEMLL